MTERFAVYWTPPPGSPLARFGAAWLGRGLAPEDAAPRLCPATMSGDRCDAITATPRHYGLHATLKPPFALPAGTGQRHLEDAVRDLADGLAPFVAPPLVPGEIDGFLALTIETPCAAMDDLAARCVADLDRFRSPAGAAESAPWRARGLSPVEERLLDRWGYPWVMERFRFHITLTDRLDDAARRDAADALRPHVAAHCGKTWPVDAISLLHQPSRKEPFALLRRHPMTGGADRGMLVLVVGASGAGKDTLLAGARRALADDPRFAFPRRIVTRAQDAGGESHVAMDQQAFAAAERAGAFALSWRAHGMAYAIPASVADRLREGRHVVVNASRGTVEDARRRFAGVRVIHVEAPSQLLAARLAARGARGRGRRARPSRAQRGPRCRGR